jgi:hypothetical protein
MLEIARNGLCLAEHAIREPTFPNNTAKTRFRLIIATKFYKYENPFLSNT